MSTWVPRVTPAAGCAGSGRELARFGDLAVLDAVLLGPVGLPGGAAPRSTLAPSPSGLVHRQAPVLPVDHVVDDLLPWFRARGLRVVCAVRGSTVGAVSDTLQRLRRSLDFATVVGVEIDLAAGREETRPAIGGLTSADPVGSWSADPQACLKLLAAARERLPRDLLLQAKLGGECPQPVAAARAAVGGGARALVLSGAVPALTADQFLVGPAVAPVTLGLVTTLRAAIAAGRVPDVPLVAVGGLHDRAGALAAHSAGAAGIQVGSGILSDPETLWRVHDALADAPPPTRDATAHRTGATTPDEAGDHDGH
ncbi:hypothetical protein [Ornithinimicrobium cavernae]|uniref:hypothetical protein n=1 Tax=Ornithinimicrobium cavernae TaxID=2666047 RepID=UPI000D6881D1|nr:hypothetical protein [Ornithinimicrobium cavernae]